MIDAPCDPCPQVEQAADRAVKKVFAILGVNIDEPREVEEFRENLRFGASMRRAANKGAGAMIIAAAGGFALVVWVGLVTKIKGSFP